MGQSESTNQKSGWPQHLYLGFSWEQTLAIQKIWSTFSSQIHFGIFLYISFSRQINLGITVAA